MRESDIIVERYQMLSIVSSMVRFISYIVIGGCNQAGKRINVLVIHLACNGESVGAAKHASVS